MMKGVAIIDDDGPQESMTYVHKMDGRIEVNLPSRLSMPAIALSPGDSLTVKGSAQTLMTAASHLEQFCPRTWFLFDGDEV